MTELRADDFSAYFEAVHGHPPFRWQSRLLAEVVRHGRWPDLVDMPTGSGKTAAIDVAVFHLALDGGVRAPRRVIMVVDRRTVVEQSFARAERIARALATSGDAIVKTVSGRLRALTGGGEPLAIAQLRGGMPRDDTWAHRPDQPVVALSTVDQVGSRLLFRGYGVSEGMRPIHAGLIGADALLLLDEVHLSQPFLETLDSVRHYRAWSTGGLPDRWQVVAMSATARGEGGSSRCFGLATEDEGDTLLVKRLVASKVATLAPDVKMSGSKTHRTEVFAATCADKAFAMAGPGKAIGVVVNRVDSAREIYMRLSTAAPEARVFLVTGRMRPIDRDARNEILRTLVGSGRVRSSDSPSVIVVATQCIEAGADLDFDALVTECASLDALRQRFGRLNRLGDIEGAEAAVLARSDSLEDDPIYGAALGATWRWLHTVAPDFGVRAMEAILPAPTELTALLSPKARAPVMLPAHLDAWAQTRPTPSPDADVSLWLHGVDRRADPEVQLVWRDDLTEELLALGAADRTALAAVRSRIEACAPVGLEAMTLPLYAVRAWLAREESPEIADVEGAPADEAPDETSGERERVALLWAGDDSVVTGPAGLRAGATILVPSAYGGVTDGTWDPSADAPVSDLAHVARWRQTGRPIWRIVLPASTLEDDGSPTDREKVDELLDGQLGALRSGPVERREREEAVLSALLRQRRRSVVCIDEFRTAVGDGHVLFPGMFVVIGRERGTDAAGEDDEASNTGVEVSLEAHMLGVADWAERFAMHCGLPEGVSRDLVLAARWHDAGKADIRFQRMLRGPAAILADGEMEPLAKSAIIVGDVAARRRARERSGYPRGARHELSSVALLEAHPSLLAQAVDRDLLLHLVASHHGWCRPFAPCAADREPVNISLAIEGRTVSVSSDNKLALLDSGVADRFWNLVARYGWFGLAWLEAILRLADHRRSEEEQLADRLVTKEAGQ